MRIFVAIAFFFIAATVHAQMHSSAFSIEWNTLKPLSDKTFIDRTSSAGVKITYTKFMNERFGLGLEGSYNTLNDYIPRQTYEYPGGAITTDIHNYLYYFSLVAHAQYYFMQGKRFTPYASVGMGIAFNEYRIFYNVYEDVDNKRSFVARPEVGTLFKIKEYSNWGLKAAIGYEYTTNKSEYFEVDNLSGINLSVGIVLFTD